MKILIYSPLTNSWRDGPDIIHREKVEAMLGEIQYWHIVNCVKDRYGPTLRVPVKEIRNCKFGELADWPKGMP